MQNINKFKLLVSIILSIVIMFTSIPLGAASTSDIIISNAEHKQIIEQFLSEIKAIQSQVADIAQSALKSPAQGAANLEGRINLINSNIERLNKIIQDYLATVPGVSDRNRHVLLTFNILNLIKSSLYPLSLLIRTTNDVERLALLDEYFRSRVVALDTLQILEELLEKFNS